MPDCYPSLTKGMTRMKSAGSASAWTRPFAFSLFAIRSETLRNTVRQSACSQREKRLDTRPRNTREENHEKEYDFSKSERGRFYKKGATVRLPIYLDATVQHEVELLASRTGRNIRDVVNRIVQKEVRLLMSSKPTKRHNSTVLQPTSSTQRLRSLKSSSRAARG